MGVEAQQSSIGSLCDAGLIELQTGPFGSQLHAYDYVVSGVPVVPTEAIKNRRIDHSVLPQVSRTKAQELSRHRLLRGDILFARRGVQATGHIGCIREAEEGFLCGTGAIRLRVKGGNDLIDADYLSHVLADPASIEWFKFHAIGATMPNLNEGIIRSFPLRVPSLPEQRAIAQILGILDDKIELNRRMGETLEVMARALFKSWFVDFDPVRTAGHHPIGIPGAAAHLFPKSFESSELGQIPKGWAVSRLRDLVAYLNRGISPVYVDAGGVCVVNQKCIRDHRIDFAKSRRHDPSRKSIEGRALRPMDVLVNSTGVGTLGRVAQILDLPEVAIVDSHVTVIRAAAPTDPWFLGNYLVGREAEIEALGEGSTGQTELSRARLGELLCLTPPPEIQAMFGQSVAPLLLRAAANERESVAVATLRDALLPKLIAGELRAGRVDQFVGRYAP
jgi:type I restriction enzyme, S subunit